VLSHLDRAATCALKKLFDEEGDEALAASNSRGRDCHLNAAAHIRPSPQAKVSRLRIFIVSISIWHMPRLG